MTVRRFGLGGASSAPTITMAPLAVGDTSVSGKTASPSTPVAIMQGPTKLGTVTSGSDGAWSYALGSALGIGDKLKAAVSVIAIAAVAGYGSVKPLRNISYSTAPSAQGTVSGSKTRCKARKQYYLLTDTTSLQVFFDNRYVVATSSGEVDNGSAITYQKLAVVLNDSIVAPITFNGGSRSATIASGAIKYGTDKISTADLFGLGKLPKGSKVELRWLADVPSAGTFVGVENNRDCSASEQAFLYDPSLTTTDDVDAIGAMSTPSGATVSGMVSGVASTTLYPKPTMIAGEATGSFVSVFALGDSIASGTGDAGSDGHSTTVAVAGGGGGWVRRACHAAQYPHMIYGVSGRSLAHYAGGKTMAQAYMALHTHGLVQMGTNDVNTSSTLATLNTNRRQIYADMHTAGITQIIQSTVGPYATTTDRWSTTANQTVQSTPAGAWTSGGLRDQFNAAIIADVGSYYLDGYIDVLPAQADGTDTHKWKTRSSWTLNTALTGSSVTTLSLAGGTAPIVGDIVTIDPAGTYYPTNGLGMRTTSVTGSGPWTVGVGQFVTTTKSAGTAVISQPTSDGLHPSLPVHADIANDNGTHGAATVLAALVAA